MHRNITNLVLVIGLLIAITACVCRSDRDQDKADPSPAPTPATAAKSTNNTARPMRSDEGDFIVDQVEVTNPRYIEIDQQIRREKLLPKAADQLNRALILPHDIFLRTKVCDEVNAFYDSNDHSVTVCYEMMEHFYRVFRSSGMSDEKAYDKMFDAVRFVFLHEIGHALIDTYKLPVAGNEEDAADRCSAYINLEELGDDGVKAVFAAAEAFDIESKHNGGSKGRDLADEHLLQEQRFYNSMCMIYGSNPKKYANILTEDYLPSERAVRCEAEYARTRQSWIDLLQPWRKN
jgi:Putative metallopeptidase